ncbi:MAG TPA: HD domain-containing protein [Lachnospiraceae bacterium]|nr:HD domain-containing protein [Lachnospiraceae bacterium]
MTMKMFAAIDVGSYELSMKIFEFSAKNGMKEIDHIRHRIDLGTDSFTTGKISHGKVDELCKILIEFTGIMKTYKVINYRAYGTSAIRETENAMIILDQIQNKTGIKIEVLSNSEQRFLDYKSIASKGEKFNKIIEKGTAIIDIGGGSLQISLFDKDRLVTTQNIRLGVLRIRDRITKLQPKSSQVEELLDEMISNQMAVFKKLYLKDREINHIIVVDDYVSSILQKRMMGAEVPGYIDSEKFMIFVNSLRSKTTTEVSHVLGIAEENATLLYISAILIKRLIKVMEADLLWAPGVTLCDGIAYEYAEKNHMLTFEHNFEDDIIACAQNISKRYMGSKRRGETLEQIALTIFDSMKKIHGLGKRDRLLLQIATLLHDCGKYISLTNVGECSYSIIMSTEIIGLSHVEREMVAHIVKYNHIEFSYYEEIGKTTTLDMQSYLTIAKLTAILRISNALDRSHKQKFKNITTTLKENELIIHVDADVDITLEKGLYGSKADFFEEVYSVRPIIKQKRCI